MPRTHLALSVILAAGCATNGNGGGGGGDGGGSGRAPFTNGVSTLAGWDQPGFVDGSRDVNLFHNPTGVAVGPDGNVYVADFDNNKLRVVTPDGTASTLISMQTFTRPFGLAFGGDGTLWVTTDSDMNGHHVPLKTGSIWRVDVHAKTATIVANAIGLPRGIAPLKDGRLAVSDYEHHVIELVDPASGKVTVLAGTVDAKGYADGAGAAARFAVPYGIVQRADGKLVVCDHDNQRIRLVGLDGSVTTLAGSGVSGFADGAMADAQLDHPEGLAIDANGDLFLTDTDNFRVRQISGTTITTIAGNGTSGYMDADDRLASQFVGLEGIAVAGDGSMVYVGDGDRGNDMPYNRVRQVKLK